MVTMIADGLQALMPTSLFHYVVLYKLDSNKDCEADPFKAWSVWESNNKVPSFQACSQQASSPASQPAHPANEK